MILALERHTRTVLIAMVISLNGLFDYSAAGNKIIKKNNLQINSLIKIILCHESGMMT